MKRAALALLVVIAGLLVDAAVAAIMVRSSLRESANHLGRAGELIGSSGGPATSRELQRAAERTQEARSLLGHPGIRLLGALPLAGDEISVLDGLAEAAWLSSEAGLEIIRAITSLPRVEAGVAGAFYRAGGFDLDAMIIVDPAVARAQTLLARAVDQLRDPPPSRLEVLREAQQAALQRVQRADLAAQRGRMALQVAPDMLGRAETRRYLLAFQSPSEARGTGGLMGIFGLLEANGGRVRLSWVAPLTDLPAPSPARELPRWFDQHYRQLGATRQWEQANLSSHFPTVAALLLQMYGTEGAGELDGVIAMDPVALAELLKSTGPISASGLNRNVKPDNASQILLRDAYTLFTSSEEQSAFLTDLIEVFWRRLQAPETDAAALLDAIGSSSDTQHLKMFSKEPAEQAALEELGAAGDFTSHGPNVQLVFHDNAGVNKVDYFLQRSLRITIQLESDGDALITTTVDLENEAPTAARELLIGPGIRGDEPGLNRMYLHVVLPQEAKMTRFAIDERPREPLQNDEAGHPLVWDVLELPAGTSSTVTVTYRLRDPVDADGSFEISLYPQATAFPDAFELTLVGAEASDVAVTSSDDAHTTTPAGVEGILERPTTISLRVPAH